jgi:MoaA/NifB/PqqE/SkfB family radical SAM enzyme
VEQVNLRGERRAQIEFGRLRDLWFMWSLCNLECAHCYVGSSPRNQTLELLSLDDVKPFLREGAEMGMEHVYFTGGEPFANREILSMIEEAGRFAPVTVLSNGTGPIGKYLGDLGRFKDVLTLRISLDHFDRERHDAVRGKGTFDATCATVRRLCLLGFVPVITVTPLVFEATPVTFDEAVRAFESLFEGLDVRIKILPSTLRMGGEVRRTGAPGPVPFLTERQMAEVNLEDFQCHYSRCVQKIAGRLRVYPCPIIYNDPGFELGATLRESARRVPLAHHGCVGFCYKFRGKCGDVQLAKSHTRGM